jgi:CMP/dCMP kinase
MGGETPTTPSPASSSAERMCAITVSRLYGSGGGEVAARLARRLGWRLLDHEVVARIAKQLGVTHEEVVAQDEHTAGFIERALSNMGLGYPGVLDEVPPTPVELARRYHEALCRVVLAAAEEGHVVIVGRGGFSLLGDRRDVLRVLITAPLPQRVAYVARREGLDERDAKERIRRIDQDRRRYVEATYHVHPGEPEQYDLTVNTAILALDDVAELICLALERKAGRLDVPEADLGPGVGLVPYPSQPKDIEISEADHLKK